MMKEPSSSSMMKTNVPSVPAKRKTIIFRLLTALSLVLSLPYLISMIVLLFQEQESDGLFGQLSLIIIAAFTLAEIIILLKNIKKELLLFQIAFNENKAVNKVPLIIANVLLVLSLAIFLTGMIISLKQDTAPELLTAGRVLGPIGLIAFLNCLIYDIYVILYRQRRFRIEDLLK